ncbi:cytochrome P450 [Chiua virens]|nr:cytochrome P450 [Chiua virens]
MTNAEAVIQEGYKKYKGAPFKIATLYHWIIIVTERAHVEEVRSARDEELSFVEAAMEDFESNFTLGVETQRNPFHIDVVRSHLTRNVGTFYSTLREEIFIAIDEILVLKDNEWKAVPALNTVQQIVARATNRIFVGLPVCRNPDFIDLNIQHTVDVITGSLAIGFFPEFLKPVAARFITNVPKNTRRGAAHLRPIVEERRKYLNEYGSDWTEKPNDLLSWLMDEAGSDISAEILTDYVLATNFAAIHTTSNVFTLALYNLAANPQYARPLREEVETVLEKEEWSRMSLGKMHKMDSFFKETIRMESINVLSLARKAVEDFVLSDGRVIPKGTRIHAGLVALHYDDTLYGNPYKFDPFRFANMREEDGEGVKHQFVTTSPEYLAFGHGRHACPGRFFAAAELKTMLAHIVMNYDLKLEENATRPSSFRLAATVGANTTAKVLFRRRAR